MKARVQLLAAAISAPLWAAASLAEPYQYLVTDLGTLSGPISSPFDIDGSGRVAGLSMLADSNFHATLWDTAPIDLGTLGADTQSLAYAVNSAGQVVGTSYNYGDLQPHGFIWQAGAAAALGPFSPRGLNDAGVVVGHRMMFNADQLWVEQACRWSGGLLTDLGSLGGHTSSAFAVNASGWAVGQAYRPDNITPRACLWIGTAAYDLGTIAGGPAARSAAADINDHRAVAGSSEVVSGETHACLFQLDEAGQVSQRTDLGVLGGGFSYAYGLNNAGVVVGSSDARAFAWVAGELLDLNTRVPPACGWDLSKAMAINDAGVIVCEASFEGFAHAVTLTPVSCLKGDVNADGSVDGLDIEWFIDVLTSGGTPQQVCAGDVAHPQDGDVTPPDADDFVQCLLFGGC